MPDPPAVPSTVVSDARRWARKRSATPTCGGRSVRKRHDFPLSHRDGQVPRASGAKGAYRRWPFSVTDVASWVCSVLSTLVVPFTGMPLPSITQLVVTPATPTLVVSNLHVL